MFSKYNCKVYIHIYDDNGYYFSLLRHFFHLVDSSWYRCDVCIKIQYFVSVSGAESRVSRIEFLALSF